MLERFMLLLPHYFLVASLAGDESNQLSKLSSERKYSLKEVSIDCDD